MVELDLGSFHFRAERLGATVRLHLLQLGELGVDILAERFLQEAAALMQANRIIDVVR